jgi:hypothetical protein
MGQTFEKRGREQRKKLRRTEKAERKKVRREAESKQPVVDVVDASYFMPAEFQDEKRD